MDLCPEFGAHYTFPHRRTRQCYVPARESPRARIRTGCRMPHLPSSGSANAAMAHASSRAGQFFRLPPWLAEARHSSSGQPSGNGPVLPYAVVQCHGEGLWRKRPVVQPGKHSLYAVRAKCRIPEAAGFLRLVGQGSEDARSCTPRSSCAASVRSRLEPVSTFRASLGAYALETSIFPCASTWSTRFTVVTVAFPVGMRRGPGASNRHQPINR